jgi:hypothetical protein
MQVGRWILKARGSRLSKCKTIQPRRVLGGLGELRHSWLFCNGQRSGETTTEKAEEIIPSRDKEDVIEREREKERKRERGREKKRERGRKRERCILPHSLSVDEL